VTRVIRKSRAQSSQEVLDLLGSLFAAELAHPSRCLWIISPWVSDVAMLDNTAGGFSALTRFGRRQVRLVEILCTLAERGSTVVIGTTQDAHNETFRARLAPLARDLHVEDMIRLDIDSTGRLHTKSIVADGFVLAGSMNITHNGIHLREEHVELHTDAPLVAQARMDAYDRFGGLL
jgi:phosphatidylserine/phosphatidylglycerophosphate/cardiolipin synthase-like enzyme